MGSIINYWGGFSVRFVFHHRVGPRLLAKHLAKSGLQLVRILRV